MLEYKDSILMLEFEIHAWQHNLQLAIYLTLEDLESCSISWFQLNCQKVNMKSYASNKSFTHWTQGVEIQFYQSWK